MKRHHLYLIVFLLFSPTLLAEEIYLVMVGKGEIDYKMFFYGSEIDPHPDRMYEDIMRITDKKIRLSEILICFDERIGFNVVMDARLVLYQIGFRNVRFFSVNSEVRKMIEVKLVPPLVLAPSSVLDVFRDNEHVQLPQSKQ